jgi:hypothetical protein
MNHKYNQQAQYRCGAGRESKLTLACGSFLLAMG